MNDIPWMHAGKTLNTKLHCTPSGEFINFGLKNTEY